MEITVDAGRLRLIKEVLETQLRLLSSYINKSERDLVRIEAFKQVLDEVNDRLLEE